MKFLAILFSVVMLSLPVKAYELLMFSLKTCPYCIAFMEEVAVDYDEKELPLTVIDVYDRPTWFATALHDGDILEMKYTPTFILYNEETGKEIARFVGYGGKEWFYERIEFWYKEYYGQ